MRVEVGTALEVSQGDEVSLVAKLVPPADLARLFVFAKERGNDRFTPYVPGLVAKMTCATGADEPPLMTPLMLRLHAQQRQKTVKFIADFDGEVRVMQEVDVATDILAKTRLKRGPNPALPFVKKWIKTWLNSKTR